MALLRTTLAALAATLLLTSCSDDESAPESPAGPAGTTESSSTGPTATATGPAADAEIAVRDFYEQLAAGELVSACGWWTDDYVATSVRRWNATDNPAKVRTCPQLLREVTKTVAIVGRPSELFAVTAVSGDLTDDDSARVEVTLASADEPETYELTLTAVGWRISGDVG
jgi:hypothetical protein